MKVEVKKLPKSEIELTISVPHEVYVKWEKKALEEISKNLKIPGFRPGNVPEEVVREKVDKEAIKARALDFVLPQTYAEAVKEHNLQVVSQPQVDIKSDIEKEGDEFVYTAKVAVLPDVKMGDYKKIKVAKKEVKVEPKKIEETITMIMERFQEWKSVDRAAKNGDRVEISFEGFDSEGKAIPNTASKNHPVIIGSKSMVPGFEEALEKAKKGDEKEFDVTFPKDYHAASMQNQKVKFKASVHNVEEKVEQKLSEEMVEKLTGKKQSVDEFKKQVEENLKMEMEQRQKQEHDNAVVNEIIKITKAEVPEALVEQEIDQMLNEQKSRVQQQGLTWEQYLSHVKKSDEDFRKDHKKGAEERILARLGVQHIIKDAKLEVKDEEVSKKIEEMSKSYPEEQRQMFNEHYKDEENRRVLKFNLAADKLINMLSK